mgnify:CR=1 FL=1
MENLYITKVVRVGSSIGIITPKGLMKQLGIERGDHVVLGLFATGQFSVRRLTERELNDLRPGIINI